MGRTDRYDELPQGMRRYLSIYGWHWSEKAYNWAVARMKDRNGQKVQPMTKDAIETQIKANGVTIEHGAHYDCAYVYMMAMSDFMGSSLKDIKSVAQYVKDVLDDADGYDGIALTRFYADCIGRGVHIDWEAWV